jgi:hypothetical protein
MHRQDRAEPVWVACPPNPPPPQASMNGGTVRPLKPSKQMEDAEPVRRLGPGGRPIGGCRAGAAHQASWLLINPGDFAWSYQLAGGGGGRRGE